MNHSNLFYQALTQPNDAISYYVTQQLTTLYSRKAVMYVSASYFDLDDFQKGGHCELALRPDILNQIQVFYYASLKQLSRRPEHAWFEVTWQGHSLDVVQISWQEGYCKNSHYWVIADTMEVAEEFYRQVCAWAAEVRGEVLVFEEGSWEKSQQLYDSIKSATFENLILAGRLKQEIQDDFAQFLSSREVYARYNLPWKRGVLLIGPPGNGKTHTVKALLNWLDTPCLYVKSFKSQYGTDQSSIRAVFQRARETTPCILVLEDLDSLITDKNRSFFLNELDGFAANTGIVVLATTNHPERLDPAILNRPSRFDRKYHFELPEALERLRYIRRWNETLEVEMRLSEDETQEMANLTDDFSFAYLKELFLSSMMRWISTHQQARMATVMRDQREVLREQMTYAPEPTPPVDVVTDEEEPDED